MTTPTPRPTTSRVQAAGGTPPQPLTREAAEALGLPWPPDPATTDGVPTRVTS